MSATDFMCRFINLVNQNFSFIKQIRQLSFPEFCYRFPKQRTTFCAAIISTLNKEAKLLKSILEILKVLKTIPLAKLMIILLIFIAALHFR